MTRRAWRMVYLLAFLGGVLVSQVAAAQASAPATLVNVEVALGLVLSSIGAWAVLALKKLYERVNRIIEQFPDLMAALYGPRDGNGQRTGGGLLDRATRIETKLNVVAEQVKRLPDIERKADEAAATAQMSREAVQTAQRIVKEALRVTRTHDDHDPEGR